MRKRRVILPLAAVTLAAGMALGGCSGSQDSGGTSEPAQSSAQDQETSSEPSGGAGTETSDAETSDAETEPAEKGTMAERPQAPADGMEPLVYEAEDASFVGAAFAKEESGYSGTGYADGLYNAGTDQIVFTVDVPYDYFYNLAFLASSGGQEKYNYVSVDGEQIGEIGTFSSDFEDSVMERVYLDKGTHEIAVTAYWGYIKIDCLTVELGEDVDPSMYEVSAELINPNADDSAKRLMSYLTDVYGKGILTGQYSDNGYVGKETYVIRELTGYNPAVIGLDLIEYSPSRVSHGSTSRAVESAIEWWEKGGIVTMCWHWNAPEKYLTGEWFSGFRAEQTSIDLAKIMNGEDEEGYELLLSDIDAIAVQLKRLQDAGVPVLWRPLHEASGGWFWWGKKGAEPYKELWKLLYDRLTNEHGLNNLIWLWNGQAADWYPGDEYVDIIGEDIYPGEQVVAPQTGKFLQANAYTDAKKMVVLSENGCVFDPDLAYRDGAMWGFYCTWSGEFVLKGSLTKYSEKYTTEEALIKMYHSPIAINLEDLPDLKTYPISE